MAIEAPSYDADTGEIAARLSEWYGNLRHGPVPGAYVPVQIGGEIPAGTPPLLNTHYAAEVPCEGEIIAVTTYIFGGTATLRINNNPGVGSTFFFLQPIAASQTWFRESFATPTSYILVKQQAFSIDLLTPVTGTPTHYGATIWLKNLSKIDPA